MKTKKNKKYHNFTGKQKRRDKSIKSSCFWLHKGSTELRRSLNRLRRSKAKSVMKRILEGKEVEFERFRNSVRWLSW